MGDVPPRRRSRRSRSLEQRFAPTPPRQAEESAATTRPARFPGGSEAILVIEDQDQAREAARSILERLGYRVVTARSAEEALRCARASDPIDLLLTDVVLPSMNGVALAERILTERPDLRVLFMSGLTSESGVPGGTVRGQPCGFLLKPFGFDSLARSVREVLDRGRESPQSRSS